MLAFAHGVALTQAALRSSLSDTLRCDAPLLFVMSNAAHLLWAAVAIYAVWRLSAVAELFAVQQSEASPLAEAANVPDDLMALAMTHSESWAQEDTLKAIRERYEQLQDWNRVRSAFGVGSI